MRVAMNKTFHITTFQPHSNEFQLSESTPLAFPKIPSIKKKHFAITPDEKSRLETAVHWIIELEASEPHSGKAPFAI